MLQAQAKLPIKLKHAALLLQLLLPFAHSLTSMHTPASFRLKPAAQAQENEPGVFVQKVPPVQGDGEA